MVWLGEPVELRLQNLSGRSGWLRLVPPHPDPQGEGTPHPALQRVEALWTSESASSNSPPREERENHWIRPPCHSLFQSHPPSYYSFIQWQLVAFFVFLVENGGTEVNYEFVEDEAH